MSDPLSVAGVAVGITSLGIQVCQVLINYYSQFKDWSEDVPAVLQRVDVLSNTLKAVEKLRQRVKSDNDEVSKELRRTLAACLADLNVLDEMARKCGQITLPKSLADQARLVKKRLLWPFRKETLTGLQNIVDRSLNSLQVALQLMDIDLDCRRFKAFTSSMGTLVTQNERIQSSIDSHNQSLDYIRDKIQDVTNGQLEQTLTLTTHVSNQSAHLCSRLETLAQTMERLVIHAEHMNTPAGFSLAVIHDSLETYQQITPIFRRDLRKYKRNIRILDRSSKGLGASCKCAFNVAARRQQWRSPGRYLSFISQKFSKHIESCPLFAHTDFSHAIEAEFAFCTRLIGYCVRAGLFRGREEGWSTVYPTLRVRAVVPWNSPAFRPFMNIVISSRRGALTADEVEQALSDVLSSFKRRLATPWDISDSGQTIFHAACSVFRHICSENIVTADIICAFLDSLLENGVPCNEQDSLGRRPINEFLLHPQNNSYFQTMTNFLAQRADTWDVSSQALRWTPDGAQLIAKALSVESNRDGFVEEDPLTSAILQQSKLELIYLISQLPIKDNEVFSSDQINISETHLQFAAIWPEGLKLLLLTRSQWSSMELSKPMEWALQTNCAESCNHLIQSGYCVSLEDWDTACYHNHEEIFQCLAENLKKQDCLKDQPMVPDTTESSLEVSQENANSTPVEAPYYTQLLTVAAAEALWSSGYRNLNMTYPLWWQLEQMPWRDLQVESFARVKWELFEWFLRRGANFEWIHPTYRISVAHLIGLRWIQTLSFVPRQIMPNFVLNLVRSQVRDSCNCPCSFEGCFPFIKALAFILKGVSRYGKRKLDVGFEWLLDTVTKTDVELPWMSRAAIQILVSHDLQLTHTCCETFIHRLHHFPPPETMFNDEIREIHNEERHKIQLLETLVVELGEKWNQFHGTFQTFLTEVLDPCMNQVCREPSDVDAEEIKKIEKIGVRLWEPFGPEPPPRGSKHGYDTDGTDQGDK